MFILYVVVYLDGGHLFRLLKCFISEPDVGMAEKDAHKFFQQLMAAVVSEANLCVDLTFCCCVYCY